MSRARNEVSEAEWAVWHRFYLMRRQLDRALERRLQADSGISAADYEILVALLQAQGHQLRSRDLAEFLGWERSRISHQVTRMESRGLVERTECDTDLRGTWVSLTREGRRTVLSAMHDHNAALREYFFDVLTPQQQDAVATASADVLDVINPPVCDAFGESA